MRPFSSPLLVFTALSKFPLSQLSSYDGYMNDVWPDDPRLEGLDSDEILDAHLANAARPQLESADEIAGLASLKAPLEDDMQLLRDVYLDGGWRLQLVESSERMGSGHTAVDVMLFDPQSQLLFDTQMGVPAGTVIDSDEVVRSAIHSVTMRPGDVEAEAFDSYTRRQMAFAAEHAEHLSMLYTLEEDKFELIEWDERPGVGRDFGPDIT